MCYNLMLTAQTCLHLKNTKNKTQVGGTHERQTEQQKLRHPDFYTVRVKLQKS